MEVGIRPPFSAPPYPPLAPPLAPHPPPLPTLSFFSCGTSSNIPAFNAATYSLVVPSDGPYPGELDCFVALEAPLPGLALTLHFTDFSTEQDSDLLFIFSSTQLGDENLLGVYSGQGPVEDVTTSTGASVTGLCWL